MSVTDKNIDKFHSSFVTTHMDTIKEKQVTIWEKIVNLIVEEAELDERFKLNVIPSGSYYEKTKVIEPNEFDFMLEIEKLKLGDDKPYDGVEDNLTTDPPLGYTTVMIDEGEEKIWRKNGLIARDEHLLKATNVKALFASYVRNAIAIGTDAETSLARYVLHLSYESDIPDPNYNFKARTHGPAVTIKVTNKLDKKVVCCIDLTLAIKDETWPEDAEEWKTRKRGGWPPKELIDSIVTDGCHLVGKKPRQPTDIPSEYLWRYSFSGAEMRIVESIEACWIDVLRFLKAIREEQQSQQYPLTSYHLKTIMFYEREENPNPFFWTKDNVKIRFKSALIRLLTCLEQRKCPHYFIKYVNLFDSRFDKHYEKLISGLTNIKDNLNEFLEKEIKKKQS